MPHSFVHLLVHIIFSTKGRAPDLTPEVSNRLFPYIGGIVRQLGAVPVMRVVKANSSRWLHEQYPARKHFCWQSGYAAFTVSASRANEVSNHIRSQQERKHGLECDARDVWS
jgi:hypothetical protein